MISTWMRYSHPTRFQSPKLIQPKESVKSVPEEVEDFTRILGINRWMEDPTRSRRGGIESGGNVLEVVGFGVADLTHFGKALTRYLHHLRLVDCRKVGEWKAIPG